MSVATVRDAEIAYNLGVLINEKTAVDILTAVIDSISLKDTDNLSETINKEEQHVERCSESAEIHSSSFGAFSTKPLDALCTLLSSVDEMKPILLETVRCLKERVVQLEDQLERMFVLYLPESYLQEHPCREMALFRVQDQSDLEFQRRVLDRHRNQQQPVTDQ
jgi:hypothetical protein